MESELVTMDPEFIQWLATLGIGGILAGFMFIFYRKDIKQYTELWKIVTEQLIINLKENTISNTKLITMLEHHELNSLRKSDILEMIEKINSDKK